MKAIFTLCIIILSWVSVPCWASDAAHKEFSAVAVSQLDLNGCHLNVSLMLGDEDFVKVDAPQKLIDSLQVSQVDQLLTLREGLNNNCGFSLTRSKTIQVTIGVTNLNKLKVNGFVHVFIKTANRSYSLDDLLIDLNGFSSVDVERETHVKNLSVVINGFSHYDGIQLTSGMTMVNVNGFSRAKLGLSQILNARADGFSSIRYSGSPSLESLSHGLSRISKI